MTASGQMDLRSRRLLEALEAPEPGGAARSALSLSALGEAAGWRPVAEELVARGWLRRCAEPDTYARTEDGRLAMAGPLDVTLYTRPGCHLCDEAKVQIAPLLRGAGAILREVNIDADPILRARYDLDVPVIFLGARKVAKHRVDPRQFRRQLDQARSNNEVNRG
jgi:glutaredoxin